MDNLNYKNLIKQIILEKLRSGNSSLSSIYQDINTFLNSNNFLKLFSEIEKLNGNEFIPKSKNKLTTTILKKFGSIYNLNVWLNFSYNDFNEIVHELVESGLVQENDLNNKKRKKKIQESPKIDSPQTSPILNKPDTSETTIVTPISNSKRTEILAKTKNANYQFETSNNNQEQTKDIPPLVFSESQKTDTNKNILTECKQEDCKKLKEAKFIIEEAKRRFASNTLKVKDINTVKDAIKLFDAQSPSKDSCIKNNIFLVQVYWHFKAYTNAQSFLKNYIRTLLRLKGVEPIKNSTIQRFQNLVEQSKENEKIYMIKRNLSVGYPVREIAQYFNCSVHYVNDIKNNIKTEFTCNYLEDEHLLPQTDSKTNTHSDEER